MGFCCEPLENNTVAILIQDSLKLLWGSWPVDMTATLLDNNGRYSLSGTCPHCDKRSVFMPIGGNSVDVTEGPHIQRLTCMLRCQGCLNYILGTAFKSGQEIRYGYHFPIGKPDQNTAPEIPDAIANDFKEALRCRYVNAYNATVEMCRRAVQAACIEIGAPSDRKLVNQIDWLAQQGIITTPLKEMAHRVRLGGNLGAHPPEDPDDPESITIGDVYADAVIEFTREFFQHVYVMPARLRNFTFKKSTPATTW